MNSRFKFPRRVRIHGGECGAVARALHHEAKINSLPAVKRNVFFTTNERKSMSTKTFFKRIATTLAISLGVSVLSLAPAAQANKDNGGGVSASCVMRSGVGAVITVTPTKWGTGDVVVNVAEPVTEEAKSPRPSTAKVEVVLDSTLTRMVYAPVEVADSVVPSPVPTR